MIRRQAGQAAVELVLAGGLLAALALGGVDVLRVLRAHDLTQRVAGQAAVLVAEHRPIPPGHRQGVRLEVAGGVLRATVRTCTVTSGVGCFDVSSTVRMP